MSLLDDLVAHWDFTDAANGTRKDSHGSHDFEDVNGNVGRTAGNLGSNHAAEFTGSAFERLDATDHDDLSGGDFDFTVACWFLIDASTGTTQMLVAKDDSGAGDREWRLQYRDGTTNIRWAVNDGENFTTVETAESSVSLDTWHFVVAWHDAANDQIGVQIDNGSKSTAAFSGGSTNTNSDVTVSQDSSNAAELNGDIDEISYWKRLLTDDEVSTLYNEGSGLEYPWGVSTGKAAAADGSLKAGGESRIFAPPYLHVL